jgi:hypothetical protein
MKLRYQVWAVLAGTIVATGGGCGASSDSPAGSSEDDLSKPVIVSDAEFAERLASAPAPLTAAKGDALLRAAMGANVTTARLKQLNDLVKAGRARYPDSDSYNHLGTEIEVLFSEAPRDLRSTPSQFGGQSFASSVTLPRNADATPLRLKVSGTASASYKLEFSVSGRPITLNVPAGADAQATAKLIGAALNMETQTIVDHLFDDHTFDSVGGNNGDFSGVDDLEVTVSGSTVVILLAING